VTVLVTAPEEGSARLHRALHARRPETPALPGLLRPGVTPAARGVPGPAAAVPLGGGLATAAGAPSPGRPRVTEHPDDDCDP